MQRNMDCNTLLYRAKSWLRHQLTAWNTGGEGVHSPYLFEWVRMVMMDKNRYYAWAEIEECRAAMLADMRELEFVDYGSRNTKRQKGDEQMRRVCDIARGSLAKRKYAEMLFRLVNWLGVPEMRDRKVEMRDERGLNIVELGTSLGVTTAYLAAADSRNKVVTMEGCNAVAEVAKENWRTLGLGNIDCVVGEITVDSLQMAIDDRVDVAFIDANHTYAATRAYFNVLADRVSEKSVIIVDDIHYNQDMERVWEEICVDERVTSTMDLYQMGLVFFDTHYWHRNYKMRL